MMEEIDKLQLKKRKIINKINTDCQLGLLNNCNMNQLIDRIKELISKPREELLTTIVKLEKETMKELLSLSLFTTYNQQLSQVTSYRELATYRQAIIKAQLTRNSQSLTTVNPSENNLINPKTVLALSLFFLVIKGMLIGVLMMKNYKKTPVESNSYNKH